MRAENRGRSVKGDKAVKEIREGMICYQEEGVGWCCPGMGVGFMQTGRAGVRLMEQISVDVVGEYLAGGEQEGELFYHAPWEREGGGCAEDGGVEAYGEEEG